jgi:hypothetical protein
VERPGEAVTIDVVPGRRVSWVGHLVRSLITRGAYDAVRLTDPKGIYRPRVVARNAFGHAVTLFSVDSEEEARAKARRLRAELRVAPSLEGWCDRYVIPSGFLDGTWTPDLP